MSHDTSRHTLRQRVTCSGCGRELSAALNVKGKPVVNRHKKPDGTRCWGYLSTDHRPIPTEPKETTP